MTGLGTAVAENGDTNDDIEDIDKYSSELFFASGTEVNLSLRDCHR